MCGRYMITSPPEAVRRLFRASGLPNVPPRWNVAPTDDVMVVRNGAAGRELVTMRWGLVPRWSKDGPQGKPMINARAETVAKAPSYRDGFRERRCLVPADGYYEWQKRPDGRDPFLFRPKGGGPFAFAGIWETWHRKGERNAPLLQSCAIVTTGPSELVRPLHDRMPVILPYKAWPKWLGEEAANENELRALLKHGGDDTFECVAVSRRVNSVDNDDAECIEPIEDGDTGADVGRLL